MAHSQGVLLARGAQLQLRISFKMGATGCLHSPAGNLPLNAPQVERVLDKAYSSWQFNSFHLAEVTDGRPLSTLAFYLITKTGLLSSLPSLHAVKLARFLRRIEAGYGTNPFHNATHAADVLQVSPCSRQPTLVPRATATPDGARQC